MTRIKYCQLFMKRIRIKLFRERIELLSSWFLAKNFQADMFIESYD